MKRTAFLAAALAAFSISAYAQSPVERGKYLEEAVVACGNCHTPKGPPPVVAGKVLAGGFEIEEAFGTARAPNITPDPDTGIGKWTDQPLINAIRHGVRPDGRQLVPIMAFGAYKDMSAEDMSALIAYLRSLKPMKQS